MTRLAVTAAPSPVLLVVIAIGAAFLVGRGPMGAAVGANARSEVGRRRLARTVRVTMAAMGVAWIALGVVGLMINLLG